MYATHTNFAGANACELDMVVNLFRSRHDAQTVAAAEAELNRRICERKDTADLKAMVQVGMREYFDAKLIAAAELELLIRTGEI